MKKWARLSLIVFGVLVTFLSSKINSKLSINTIGFEDKLKENNMIKGSVEDLIDFEYDYVHVFATNQSRESMEKQIGFELFHLQESISDNMSNILFVKNRKPVAYIYGKTRKDGYIIEMDQKNTPLVLSKEEVEGLRFIMKELIDENPPYKKYIINSNK